jgi:hypothetical protein
VAVREAVAARPVFAVEGIAFSWADVVAAARLAGAWEEVEAIVRAGLACERRLAAAGERVGPEEVVAATQRFRYASNLIAGEELAEWLDHWGLDVSEWRAYVARSLLREQWAGELGDTVGRYPVADDDVAEAVWGEAACSGFLPRYAQRLAVDCALAAAAGEPIAHTAEALARIHAAAEAARREAVSDEAVAREVAQHRLEWLRIDGELLELPAEDVAREAALCVREDGRPLAEVATDAGTTTAALRAYVEEIDPALSAALVGAREGELVGPIAHEDGFALVRVDGKTLPEPADRDVRRRAEERIAARAAQRAILEHVEWHEQL